MRRLMLAIFSLVTLSGQVWATTYYINLNDYTPAGSLYGPCYCGSGPYYSFSGFQDGDLVNFGSVTISAVFDSHSYGRIYPPPEGEYAVVAMKMSTYLGGASLWSAGTFPWPLGSTFHDLTDTATFDLIFTVPSAFSIGWDGPGAYRPATAPAVPEPSTWAMLLIGFAGIGFAAYRMNSKARA
jgi:PEP-CTERM motif